MLSYLLPFCLLLFDISSSNNLLLYNVYYHSVMLFYPSLKQPKIDKDHSTWLHLRIREFDPKFTVARGHPAKSSGPAVDGRWTLGFPSAKACENARLLILEEICKQRTFVESILDPLLQDDYIKNMLDSQDN